MRRSFVSGDRKNNVFRRLAKYADALANAAWMDFYGVSSFDVMIAGPDRLLNMVLAYRAAARGKRVCIYHGKQSTWADMDIGVVNRVNHFDPSFARLLEAALGLKGLGSRYYDVLQNLGFYIDSLLDPDGEPLVFQIDGCKLFFDPSNAGTSPGGKSFWIEPDPEKHVYPGVERLLFWPESYADKFATEEGKCPEHRLEVSQIWFTATPTKELSGIKNPDMMFGESKYPLRSHRQFTGNDRLRDLTDALGGLCL